MRSSRFKKRLKNKNNVSFHSNGGKAILDNKYGRGNELFLLDDTTCAADMNSLAQCSSSQQPDCGPGDAVVGLECNAVSGGGVTTFKPPVQTTLQGGTVGDNCPGEYNLANFLMPFNYI